MNRSVSEHVERAHHRSGARGRGQRRDRWRRVDRPATLAAIASALVAVAFRAPQDPPAAAPAAKSAPAAVLTASDILAKAIATQGLPPSRDPAADLPLALHAKVNLQYKSEQGDVISVDAERKFLGETEGLNHGPGRIWTRVVPTSDAKAETIVAFDGKRPWLWSRNTGKVRWLDEPGGEDDLAQLEADLESTALLTRAFLLRNLAAQWKDLKRLDDVTAFGMTAWVIEGTAEAVRSGAKKPIVLRLFVEQKSGWLMGARVMAEGEQPLQICFTKHERVSGVVVPGKIELYWNDEGKPRQTFYVTSLELAPELKPEEFAPPTKS